LVLDYQREEREPQQQQHEDLQQLRVAGAGWSKMAPSSLIPPALPAVPPPPERKPPDDDWHGHPRFSVENPLRRIYNHREHSEHREKLYKGGKDVIVPNSALMI
jgi:hypothetical protein